jgi:hypothetical protein
VAMAQRKIGHAAAADLTAITRVLPSGCIKAAEPQRGPTVGDVRHRITSLSVYAAKAPSLVSHLLIVVA